MGKRTPPPEPAEIHEVMLRDALEERYLAYALSTITGRALPDARDGLKPVHRRILYGMRSLSLNPGSVPKKSAKIVGEVMGSYHPHGDQAIYDAMVRLAQDFASRYPLVDGQGNFGNIDGDNPAAMRYTEARLTDVARLLLEGIDEDAVELKPTYDNSGKEPAVLPGGFPNLLANGSQGIAVGMATSIPPHNAAELCEAALHLIEKPDAKSKSLLKWVKGPDFPTGGIVVDSKESITEAYVTGRGSFRVRSKWNQEEGARGRSKTPCLPTLTSNFAAWLTDPDDGLRAHRNRHGGMRESPYNVYATADGWIAILCISEPQWRGLCELIDRLDLRDDPDARDQPRSRAANARDRRRRERMDDRVIRSVEASCCSRVRVCRARS